MDRLTDVLFRNSKPVLVGWVLLAVVGGWFALGLESRAVPGGEASATSQAEAVAQELGRNHVPSLFVVVTGKAATPEGERELDALRRKLSATPGVREVLPLPLPPPAPEAGPVTALGVSAVGGIDGSIGVADELLGSQEKLVPEGSRVFLGGYGAHRQELVQLSRSDLLRAEQVGVPIVLVVLLLTFGSLWATLVPLAIGASALLGGLGAAGVLALGIPFSEYVTNAAAMVGLALAVDYAMFLVQRVREALLRGVAVAEAIRGAQRTTGVAIAWSGLTVMVAESTMFLVDSRAIRTAALGMILVTFAAIVAALVGAPIVLRMLGYRILRRGERKLLGKGRLSDPDGTEHSGFWERWGVRVTRRPVLWLATGTVVLGVFCVPALDLGQRVALPSASQLPTDSQVRQATELGAKAYGPGAFAPIEIVVHASPATARAQADQVVEAVAGHPEVRFARPVPLDRPEVHRVSVATDHGPADERTHDLVRDLRDGRLSRSLAGIRYDVGGETAMRIDATDALFAGLPLMLAVLLGSVLVLLIVAMRSIILPLKAILLVVISLGASTGGLVLLSTTEFGAALIGWSAPAELHPIVPITIVAIVIALSTDYEVILIARIAEHHRETGDNTASIIKGMARTGRVISSAAAIMVAVFFGFALSEVTPLKQLGVGLAIAVLIDATVVRGVLVPAGMQLMGRWNWWLPTVKREVGENA
ncbi:MMPL family transporter [Allokutzneria albata]|uniref:Putative drug exporter of the RND superfamily n=1 Tax=Allokutzneria albata TaxID=211114 RepID=A0A1G9S5X4_ALLAB|nr:MMPL family transporter [Allokutzneria albata]SDM30909.1 putative drug exporter of the RND superfamily [Allokutzneria albata]